MTHRLLAATLLVALFPAAGCTLYFGNDDVQCGDVPEAYPGDDLRNPDTGTCEYQGGGGGGGCYDYYDAELPGDYPADLDWASCNGGCEALDETTCLAADTCRAAYYESCPECDDISPPEFYGCWGVAPSGPVTGGQDCAELDAYGCSRRNDCGAVYADAWGTGTGTGEADAIDAGGLTFLYCQAEVGVQCGDQTCAPGSHCGPKPLTMTPVKAAASIIPSSAMLTTPARSAMSPPSAGSSSGVEMRMIEARNAAEKMD